MSETLTAPAEAPNRVNQVPITDDVLNVADFNSRIVGAYNDGTAELGCPPTSARCARSFPRHGHLARLFLHRAGDSAAQQRELRRLHGVRHRVPGHRHPRKGRYQVEAREELAQNPDEAEREHYRKQFGKTTKFGTSMRRRATSRVTSASSLTRPSAKAAPNVWTPAAITARSPMLKKDDRTLKRYQRTWNFYTKMPRRRRSSSTRNCSPT
jgi:hypothetical protein